MFRSYSNSLPDKLSWFRIKDDLKNLLRDSHLKSELGEGGTSSSSSANSSNNSIQHYKYDVFISFRGPDTRNTFVDHLYAHLIRKGLFVFKDDTRLEKGESISPQLLHAIKNSRVSIVVFSMDYASSSWCLDEMTAIAECHLELKQTVFPVFYNIDPSHIRKQKAMEQFEDDDIPLHSARFADEPCPHKVSLWRAAMTYLAGLAGWDVRNKPESREIENIAQGVIKKLGHRFSGSANDLIGIQPRVEALENLLKLNSKVGVSQVLGIWGMDGIGKTTLATVLYDRISCQFDACCFLDSVSKIYKDGGATVVQKLILRQTIGEENLDTYSPVEISGIMKDRLNNRKLLIVLDDIDQIEQLQELHISPIVLHTGSRIIITTKDEHILKEYGADKIYETQLMNDDDARELLCRKAFKSDSSSNNFSELIHEVLQYAQGLPLAIKVMGSFLCARNASQWRAALDGLQDNPPDERIRNVLLKGFEGLEPRERDIFLHVACFFNGERKDYVWRVLHACGLNPTIGIPLLVEKSLITIRNHEFHMHGMFQELGKHIVRREKPDEPGFWSRMWLHEDFHRVMTMTEMTTIKAKAIVLDQKEDGFKFNELRAENLSKMEHLKLLILHHKNFSGTPLFLSNSLHYLLWNGYPFNCLPSKFQPYFLVELIMPNSSMKQLWTNIQKLPNLKIMDLSNSKNLKATPCFSGMLKLERLDLAGCISLWDVHQTVGLLKELKFLSLQNCRSLVCFDFGRVSNLDSLKVMCLSGCTKLESTPDFTGAFNLEYLDMDLCASLCTIHKSIGGLAKLKFLTLRDCTNLVRFPLVCIFSSPPLQSLIFLDLSFCNISELPDVVGDLRCLERLNLQGNKFSSVPSTIERLSSLAYLNLSHCHMLEEAPKLPTRCSPSGGKYFETTSGSRDHRSGLYIFDCPKTKMAVDIDMQSRYNFMDKKDRVFEQFALTWLERLLKEPRHFRCGIDIVHPWEWKVVPSGFIGIIFNGGSIVRIKDIMYFDWVGFIFCVAFEVNSDHPSISGSPLPHPFYLSFEGEHTEERFDMLLSLERHLVDGESYLWTIYISRDHCHFFKSEAQITFKAQQGLIVNQWGLRVLTDSDINHPYIPLPLQLGCEGIDEFISGTLNILGKDHHLLDIDHVEESVSSSFEPKIQLPYNWLVSEEDEIQNEEAKSKETDLFNQGLLTA